MMFKFLKIIGIGFILSVKKLLPILFLFTGFQANASVIGNLTYDGTYISGDGRTYLGIDTIASRDYTWTFNATQVDGEYEDYRIANTADADYFIGSLFGAEDDNCSTVDGSPTNAICGAIPGWTDGLFGANFNSNADKLLFIADESISEEVGYVQIDKSGAVHQSERWGSIAREAYQSSEFGMHSYYPTSWLLVKDTVASVPGPSSIALMGLGIFGIGFARRRRQS
jgi:hypothetical protein